MLSFKMEKKVTMLLKELERAKTDRDFIQVENKICFLPKKVIKEFYIRAEKQGLIINHGDEIEYIYWLE